MTTLTTDELRSWARSNGALQRGLGSIDDVEAFADYIEARARLERIRDSRELERAQGLPEGRALLRAIAEGLASSLRRRP